MGIFDWELRISDIEYAIKWNLATKKDLEDLTTKYLKQQELLDRTLAVVEKMADKVHTHQTYKFKKKNTNTPLEQGRVDTASDPKIVDTTR